MHPLGPCPGTKLALERADRRRYPDPEYSSLKDALAAHHGVEPTRIVVGAGASEIISRLVSVSGGPILVREPTFVEYRKAASAHERPVIRARSDEEFLGRMPEAALAFLCHPNNPDGQLHSPSFLDRAATMCRTSGCRLALDLAYAPMSRLPLRIPEGVEQVWAPNKPMDCAGVRAGYLVTSDEPTAALLNRVAPSWILSAEGVELLREFADPATSAWLEAMRPKVEELLRKLHDLLHGHGWQVRMGDANFLVARPSPPWTSETMASSLRSEGVRVRDASNMGLPGWLRLAARPDAEQELLDAALRRLGRAS